MERICTYSPNSLLAISPSLESICLRFCIEPLTFNERVIIRVESAALRERARYVVG
jgi:hypothetical protein